MSLETILAELSQLTEEERQLVGEMISDLSDESSREKRGQSESPQTLLPADYWTKIFAGWDGKGEENLPDDLSLNHDHYVHGALHPGRISDPHER
jgi:hypothetical protein